MRSYLRQKGMCGAFFLLGIADETSTFPLLARPLQVGEPVCVVARDDGLGSSPASYSPLLTWCFFVFFVTVLKPAARWRVCPSWAAQ